MQTVLCKTPPETHEYINQQESAGSLLVIRPDEALPIKQLEKDPEVLRKVYSLGRDIALRRLSEIKEYMK